MDKHKIICDEKDISTIKQKEKEQARIQEKDAIQERQKSACTQKGKRKNRPYRI